MAQMEEKDALNALEYGKKAWNQGQGIWPQMSVAQRIDALENVLDVLMSKRDEIINILMWEICKNSKDAASEFDITMELSKQVIEAFKTDANNKDWKSIGGVLAKIRRTAIGIVLCLGPFTIELKIKFA